MGSSDRSWAELVAEAEEHLRDRGVNPDELDLDSLLDPEEVERINRRHQGGFQIKTDLDPYDVIVAVAAGLAACIVDALVVRIPADTKWYGQGETLQGSPLTKALRDLATDPDNWLAAWAKVPYDHDQQPPPEGARTGVAHPSSPDLRPRSAPRGCPRNMGHHARHDDRQCPAAAASSL